MWGSEVGSVEFKMDFGLKNSFSGMGLGEDHWTFDWD